MRRATDTAWHAGDWNAFQSTLSMRRATGLHARPPARADISIHALHEESDTFRHPNHRQILFISIHALHEESDVGIAPWSKGELFQSTLSMRRATGNQQTMQLADIFQSTLSMRRATKIVILTRLSKRFQSTLSMRRATCMAATPASR